MGARGNEGVGEALWLTHTCAEDGNAVTAITECGYSITDSGALHSSLTLWDHLLSISDKACRGLSLVLP